MAPLHILVTTLLGLLLGLYFTSRMIKLGHYYELLDVPGRHKRHKKPTPYLGGVALFITVWLTVIISFSIFWADYSLLLPSAVYVLIGALIITLVGLSDDLAPLSAWIKLVAQIAAGIVLFMGGIKVDLVSTPFGSMDIGSFSIVITILWVVLLTNAINLIDGLDGLAAGVSLIGAITLSVIGQLYQVGPVLIFLYAVIGFLGSFLYFNRYPARIFLGDSGSMQLGYYFAVFSLIFPLKSYTAAALYLPLLALGVPLVEILASVSRRLIAGRNIMKADRRHLFHYLSLSGLSPRRVVFVFYLLAVVFGLFTLAMFLWNRLIVLSFLIAFMVVIFAWFFILLTKIFPARGSGDGK